MNAFKDIFIASAQPLVLLVCLEGSFSIMHLNQARKISGNLNLQNLQFLFDHWFSVVVPEAFVFTFISAISDHGLASRSRRWN